MNVNVDGRPVVMMPLDALVLEAELQPRALLDRATWEEYMFLLGDQTELPPVIAFSDGETHWLADGYHRWHAHKALQAEQISVQIFRGTREEALRYSLRANATHGKRREPGDYARSYAIAVRHGFVRADDTVAVQEALQCSMRCAYDLTEPARKKVEAARDAEIAAKKADGKSNRAIARETGVDESTVRRREIRKGAADLQPAETPHPPEIPGQALFDEMTSPRGERWWGAYRALQKINEQAPIDDLFAEPYDGIPKFGHTLRRAQAWINALSERYSDGK